MPGLGDYGNSANEINMVITATDNASAKINGVIKSTDGMKASINAAKTAFVAISGAIIAVGVAVNKLVGEYTKYADQVRKLSQLNGTSSIETSRLIQVTDDYKVTVENLNMATRKLAQQGLSLTVDSLAKMSDEYLALGTNAEKTAFLLDKFGRSGLQLVEVMQQGGKAIREQADAVDKSLLLTSRQLKAARDYQFKQDELNDSIYGFKIAAGNYFIPYMVKIVEGTIDGIEQIKLFRDEIARLNGDSTKTADQAGGKWSQFWKTTVAEAAEGIKGFNDVITSGQDVKLGRPYQFIGGLSEAQIIAQKIGVETGKIQEDLDEAGEEAFDFAGELSSVLSFGQNYK